MSDERDAPWHRKHRDELFIALQRLLPQHLASRLLGRLAASEHPWIKDRLIRAAIRQYRIDLEEMEIADLAAYPSFNAFFTRKLKPDARPIDAAPDSLVSPADGTISQLGIIDAGQIFQAKGRSFSTRALLDCSQALAENFVRGSFATLYLSPRDYHRVHMPVAGRLLETRYVPGRIFSVNSTTARHVDQLFARNERLVCLFDTEFGKVAVVLVGALFVAGIETAWQQTYAPGKLHREEFDPPLALGKGDELGLFKFGSTVVVLTENPVMWREDCRAESPCRMGSVLGRFAGKNSVL